MLYSVKWPCDPVTLWPCDPTIHMNQWLLALSLHVYIWDIKLMSHI